MRHEHEVSTRDHVETVSGSFRDPSGFVFVRDSTLLRQVNPSYAADYDRLVASGLAENLFTAGYLIRHEDVTVDKDRERGAYRVLRPERIPFVSYPYEWSFSQLRDAALLTLRVQKRALKHGMSLKDASAYNVQFLRGKPVLIDTLSFETHTPGQPWVAYRQFCQHFLAPLALMAHRDVRLSQLFRVFIDGVPLDLASTLLPSRTWMSLSLGAHVHLHARAQKRYAGDAQPASRPRTVSERAAAGLLESLASGIGKLRWTPEGTEWGDYYSDTNYTDAAAADKARLVSQALDRFEPRTVWDIGANVGRFSRLASSKGIDTVAFDVDPAAVEKNYVECVRSSETHLLPLILDLTNPSSGLGWGGDERESLEARGRADVVLALALIHHLAIGNNVPFLKVAQYLARLGRHLVIEFVPKRDSQVQRLLVSRVDVFPDYTDAAFERAFEEFFTIEAKIPIVQSERTLYVMSCRFP